MKKVYVIVFAAVTVVFAGCGLGHARSSGSSGSTVSASAAMAKTVEFKVVSSGVQRGVHDQRLHVITTDKQLASLISMAKLSGEKPSADFSRDELVGVFLSSNLGCGTDGLKVNSVKESDTTVTVYASRLVRKPNAKGGACTIMRLNGFAYVLISIPKTSKAISLVFE